MKKNNLMKEVLVAILLLIIIMLILAVALYDFIPANINVPEEISYSSDSKTTSVKQEIAYTNGGDVTADESLDGSADYSSEEEMITALKSYSIDAADLTMYGQKNLYNSGNSNPFDYAPEDTTPAEGTTATNTTNTTNTTSTTNTTNTTTGGQAGTGNTTSGTKGTSSGSGSTTGTFFEKSTSK